MMYGTVLIANLLYVAKARSYYAIIIVVECQFDFGYLPACSVGWWLMAGAGLF
jgi:hypothetical protein